MHRFLLPCLLVVACTASPATDPLANVRARVWTTPSEVASDPERFEDMRGYVDRLVDEWLLSEILTRHGGGWIYAAGSSGVCGIVAYLDAELVVRDIETFMAYGSLRIVTADDPRYAIEVIEHWHAGTGLDAVTRYAVSIVDDRIERHELE